MLWTFTSKLEDSMPALLVVALPVVATLVLVRAITNWKWGRCVDGRSQEGRVFIVTGANSGLGKETTRMLAMRKARVVMACRDMASAYLAVEDIRRTTPLGELIPMQLDLASLESVYTFAMVVLSDFPKVHVLINNAGVSIPDEDNILTEDDIEIHFGVNHLGHFFLTNLLLERLKEAAPGRVINVASLLHQQGVIDFDHLATGPSPSQVQKRLPPAYCNSKLCQVYHAQELARRVPEIDVYTLCPGWCNTGLMRHYNYPWYKYITIVPIAFLFMRSSSKGAQCIVQCAVEQDLSKNYGVFGFYRNCKPFTSTVLLDKTVASELWDYSDSVVKSKAPSIVKRSLKD